MEPLTAANIGSSVLAVGAALFLFVIIWPHRDEPTARPLLVVAIAAALGGILHPFVVQTTTQEFLIAFLGRPMSDTLWVLTGATTIVATGAWVVFAVRYTGRSPTLHKAITLGVITLALVAAGLTALAMVSGPTVPIFRGISLLYLLAGLLVTVGIFLLVWTAVGQNAFPYREPALLSLGALGLLASVLFAQQFEQPVLFPTVLTLGVGLLAVPVSRYPTFEGIPAARTAGRDRVIEGMNEGVLIVDDGGHLYDANPAATSLLDFDPDEEIGETIERVIGADIDPDAVVQSSEPIGFQTDDGRSIEIVGNRISDHRDRSFGAVLLCEDVTERRVEENQLHLLSRFLVDVVRSRMEQIERDATARSDADDESVDGEMLAERIWMETTTLTALVSRTRDIESTIVEADVVDHTDVRSVVRAAISETRSTTRAEVSFDDGATSRGSDYADTTVAIPGQTLQTILEDVLETTVEWSNGAVEVTVVDQSPIEVRVSAAKAGHSAQNDRRSELPLLLAVPRLGIEEWGGSLTVSASDTERQTVSVVLPEAATAHRHRRESKRASRTIDSRDPQPRDISKKSTSASREDMK